MTTFRQFFSAYVEALEFTALDMRDDEPGVIDLRGESYRLATSDVLSMARDCWGFLRENFEMIDGNFESAGHDFAFTRNGHGAGFWDGDWPEHGDALTEASQIYSPQSLYVYGAEDGALLAEVME